MGVLDQTTEPETLGDLLRLVKVAFAKITSLKHIPTLPDGTPIVATVDGTPVPHGSLRRIPRGAFAQAVGDGPADAPTIGAITRTHVTVYAAAAPTVCQLLVIL